MGHLTGVRTTAGRAGRREWLGVWIELLVLFVGGLVILGCGGECLVRGAAQLARQLGVAPLVVGLTIVAFGTSAPEIAVSIRSAARGHDALAVANAVGSCIMNVLVVLGLAALVRPLRVSRNIQRIDAPFMVFFTAVFLLFAVDDGRIDRWQGLFFVGSIVLYTAFTYLESKRQPDIVAEEYEHDPRQKPRPWPVNLLAVIIGLVGLTQGADLIVQGAVGLARSLGVSPRIIGLTIVALGTSLPEMATCIVAARRNQPDIAIGNIVGSNIFNILAVIGLSASIYPLKVPQSTINLDAPVMLATAVLMIPIMRTGRRVSRTEGLLLLACYGGYLAWMLRGIPYPSSA